MDHLIALHQMTRKNVYYPSSPYLNFIIVKKLIAVYAVN